MEIKEISQEELAKSYNQKMNAFFQLTTFDLLSLFDLANAIASNQEILVTENKILLSSRDKITSRIKKFKILTPIEFQEFVKKNKLKVNIKKEENRSYIS